VVGVFKGTVSEMFFYHSIVSRLESKDFNFGLFWSKTLVAFSVFGEYAKIFQQLMRTP